MLIECVIPSKLSFISEQNISWKIFIFDTLSHAWRIKIGMACVRIILRVESQITGNSPLLSCSLNLNPNNQLDHFTADIIVRVTRVQDNSQAVKVELLGNEKR